MILTEEEAKTKRCHEAYAACTAVSAAAVAYSAGGAYMMATAPSFCIGSACMAWRWGQWDEDPTTRQRLGGTRGFCGKAGRP